MSLQVGSRCEFGIWLSGTETLEQIYHFKSKIIPQMIKESEQENPGIKLVNVVSFTKRPGEDRVPKVPEHISGPDVRLLVVEADVVEDVKIVAPKGISHDLDEKSLNTLRRATRRAHANSHPGMPQLNNAQCDAIINHLGPDIITRMLRGQIPQDRRH